MNMWSFDLRRTWLCGFAACLSIVLSNPASAQKAEIRQELGRECHAVATGQASLVSFPTRTKTNVSVPVEGILMMPEARGPFAAVVMLHGGPGIIPPRCFRKAQELFAGWGYAAMLVDSFSAGYPDKGRNDAPTMEDRAVDAWAAARYLATRSDIRPESIVVIGWSMGGLATLLAVSETLSGGQYEIPTFQAAVAVAPECVNHLQQLNSRLIILHGEVDQTNPVEDCRKMHVSMKTGSAFELVTYPKARHTFDLPGSPDHNAEAEQDALRRIREHFSRYTNSD